MFGFKKINDDVFDFYAYIEEMDNAAVRMDRQQEVVANFLLTNVVLQAR